MLFVLLLSTAQQPQPDSEPQPVGEAQQFSEPQQCCSDGDRRGESVVACKVGSGVQRGTAPTDSSVSDDTRGSKVCM